MTNEKNAKGEYICETCGGVANPRNVVWDYYDGKNHKRCECDECKREITALQNED
jgi:hypothetical protein